MKWLAECSVAALREALMAVAPELGGYPVTVPGPDGKEDPLWHSGCVPAGDQFFVKFAWSRPAALRLAHGIDGTWVLPRRHRWSMGAVCGAVAGRSGVAGSVSGGAGEVSRVREAGGAHGESRAGAGWPAGAAIRRRAADAIVVGGRGRRGGVSVLTPVTRVSPVPIYGPVSSRRGATLARWRRRSWTSSDSLATSRRTHGEAAEFAEDRITSYRASRAEEVAALSRLPGPGTAVMFRWYWASTTEPG